MKAFGAIVKLTFRHAVRSHIFQLLLFALMLCVVLIPTTVLPTEASDFLKSSIFYSLWIVSAVLGLSSIWLGCYIMTCDIDSYQLHMVVCKPVSRLTVWCGKWVGICLINLILLVAASATVYGIILWRFNHLDFSKEDRAKMNSEVLVGRRLFLPDKPDMVQAIRELIDSRISRIVAQGRKVTPEMQKKIIDDAQRDVVTAASEIRPGNLKTWRFSNLPGNITMPIYLRYRPYINKVASEDQRKTNLIWSVAIPRMLTKEQADSPVMLQKKVRNYELMLSPLSNEPETVMTGVFHEKTLKPEWKIVTPDHQVLVSVVNLDSVGGTHFYQPIDGPKLLIPVTSFAGNYARAILVTALELMLLAALSCAFGGILSMPVAVFSVISYLLFGAFSVFMVNLDYIGSNADRIGQWIGKILLTIVIPLQNFDVSSVISDGVLIEWSWIGSLIFNMIILRALPLILLGMWIYRRRELGLIIRK